MGLINKIIVTAFPGNAVACKLLNNKKYIRLEVRKPKTDFWHFKLTPWKESYDQPRKQIKKQRHYFVNKGLSSQGYGFSSGHVWM